MHGGWQAPYFDDVMGRLVTEGITDADGFLLWHSHPALWEDQFGESIRAGVLRSPAKLPWHPNAPARSARGGPPGAVHPIPLPIPPGARRPCGGWFSFRGGGRGVARARPGA